MEDSNSPTAAEATTSATSHSLFSYITPFDYFLFLTLSLIIFSGYLILPKGFRAQYFGAGRRRYRRRRRHQIWRQKSPSAKTTKANQSLPPRDVLDNIYAYSHSFSPQEHVDQLLGDTPTSPTTSYRKSDTKSSRASSTVESVWSGIEDESRSTISTMGREKQKSSLPRELRKILMQPPGIKFVAHGTKCKPRPVWITLHYDTQYTQQTTSSEYQNCLTWRAELKPSSSQKTSSSMTPDTAELPRLGNLRKVEMAEVLGIELGKRTTALRRLQTAKGALENSCFSLLTKTGTLDLECSGLNDRVVVDAEKWRRQLSPSASAEEVRAAFITCLALAMSSKGLRLNGLRQTLASPASSSLQSQLHGLGGGAVASPLTGQWEEISIYTGLLSEAKTISTVSF